MSEDFDETPRDKPSDRKYDVALSFAGEQRPYVQEVAAGLTSAGLTVFYDEYHEAELWGKDLYSHLDRVYREDAQYCLLFLSSEYAEKVWTKHERRSAQARAFREHSEYVLPVRFDDTEIEGLPETIGYIDARTRTASALVELTVRKVGAPDRPRISDGLEAFHACVEATVEADHYWYRVSEALESAQDAAEIRSQIDAQVAAKEDAGTDYQEPSHTVASDRDRWAFLARSLYQAFTRMNQDERMTVGALLAYGCPGELPALVHMDPVELTRLTGFDEEKALGHLSDVRSLGFTVRRREPTHAEPDEIIRPEAYDLALEWWCSGLPEADDATVAAYLLLDAATASCCREHGMQLVRSCDFSQA